MTNEQIAAGLLRDTPRCCINGCWRPAKRRDLCVEHLDESLRLTMLVANHLAKYMQKGEVDGHTA